MTTVAQIQGRGLLSARPAAGSSGLVTNAVYYATDSQLEYQYDGAAWQINTAAAGAPSGAAGGDLGGNFPNPTVPGLATKAATVHQHAAADLTSGVLAPVRLGSGVADATTILYGDQTYKPAPSGGGGGGFASPMTAPDDLIIGGASGAPTRLGKGADGQVLTVDPTTHHLVWMTPAAGGGGGGGAAVYPQRTPRLSHGDGTPPADGTTVNYDGGSMGYYPVPAPSATNHPAFTQSFILAAGNYRFSVFGQVANIYGIFDVEVDGVVLTSIDCYGPGNSGGGANAILTAPVTIVGSGRHLLRIIPNGKNAASGNYYVTLVNYAFLPTAAETISVV